MIVSTVDAVVNALCLDYFRRRDAITGHTASHRTETEFKYLNYKIFDASAEIVGEMFAEIYIREVGGGVGYAKSDDIAVSESTYKRYKRLIRDNIAKKLHLKD